MTIHVRAVSADDWQMWRETRLAALTDAPEAFGSRLQEWADAPADRWRDRLTIQGAINLLAVDPDRDAPVGMASAIPDKDSNNRVELVSMWVHPAVRGSGVATALIAAIVDWAVSVGVTTLTLCVMPDNVAAQRTYEKNGFAESTQPGDLMDSRSEIVMFRDLSPGQTSTA